MSVESNATEKTVAAMRLHERNRESSLRSTSSRFT